MQSVCLPQQAGIFGTPTAVLQGDGMKEKEVNEEGSERASDEELFAILRRIKKHENIPALTTSQINEIGGFDYSNHHLNDRLEELHNDGILGHMKASNRHIWWLSSEGKTEEVGLPKLEELIKYDQIDPSKFDQKKPKKLLSTVYRIMNATGGGEYLRTDKIWHSSVES